MLLLRHLLAALLMLAGTPSHAADRAPDFLAYLQERAPALVAFNPAGYDPYAGDAERVDDATLRADLDALRPAFDGLILYAFDPALTPRVVDQAAALGYRAVLLGIWDPRSDAEVAGIAALLDRHRHRLALAVCIGNEGINDNRYTVGDLLRAQKRLREAAAPGAAVPVTTSEPAGDYGWPPLQAFGEFLAPNIHPAIDQEALQPAQAVAWVRERAEAIARFTQKPVLVKETGVPHGGATAHSLERQRAFWAAWLDQGRTNRVGAAPTPVFYSAAFEAFDMPWKAARLNSPIESHWGLMSADRSAHPAFHEWARRPPAPR